MIAVGSKQICSARRQEQKARGTSVECDHSGRIQRCDVGSDILVDVVLRMGSCDYGGLIETRRVDKRLSVP
jgi:hypothetical protein